MDNDVAEVRSDAVAVGDDAVTVECDAVDVGDVDKGVDVAFDMGDAC